MSSFEDFIKKSSSVSSKLKEALKAEKESKGFKADDRYWKPSVDKSGKGGAIIRFLPPPDGEDMPYVKYYHHAFKNGNLWYIEKSRTTLGEPDPVSEYNTENWETNYSKDDKLNRKRKLSYVSNIYVIKDPINPENDGKHFLFRYGVKIFEKLMGELEPEEDDLGLGDDPKEPYEPWQYFTGANFIIKIKQTDNKGGKGQYWNYDDSKFDKRGPLVLDEDVSEKENIKLLKELHGKLYSLEEFVAPDSFKTYEQLKKRLNIVLGVDTQPVSNEEEGEDIGSHSSGDDTMNEVMDEYKSKKSLNFDEEEDEEDEDLAEFAKLVE